MIFCNIVANKINKKELFTECIWDKVCINRPEIFCSVEAPNNNIKTKTVIECICGQRVYKYCPVPLCRKCILWLLMLNSSFSLAPTLQKISGLLIYTLPQMHSVNNLFIFIYFVCSDAAKDHWPQYLYTLNPRCILWKIIIIILLTDAHELQKISGLLIYT